MQAKMPFKCIYEDQSTLVRTWVTAVDVRDAITRFFTTDAGMGLAHYHNISVDLIQTVPANFDTHHTLSGDGWKVSVAVSSESQEEAVKKPAGEIYLPEGPVRNTILAALRYYQEQGMGEPENRSDSIQDIATNGGDEESLNEWGIEELCQSINDAEGPASPVVIVRCDEDDRILVQANHQVTVVHLNDNVTGDGGPDLVELCGTEMWKQVFEVAPSDLSDILPALNLAGACSGE
ncbi:hypothetical protein V4Z64_006351 [Pseudomonas aeruginosa]|uniref:hypothetical protein n=1 Tax=Pseudomonas aeruginosa TaxID=287 RepID=UPI0015F058FA|nr:hypothetical protein [Pseudomonas aeruginosa]MBA5106067.1 hypothetical protein [Pseudomonas aeruginosa]MDP5990002.1 hypothetical protein [Pseudomonas aeruginosa]HCE9175720.1 hypothetical protein [Pseudomonas aeruginosa]HEJ9771293.1 hypothetical protein [Pseudomonas aeruginosa]HEO1611757.1 hypothetical protein [Pseudomonas aeruginosa]